MEQPKKYGEPGWWLSVYQVTVNGIRDIGLPSKTKGYLAVKVPSLLEQARLFRPDSRTAYIPDTVGEDQ